MDRHVDTPKFRRKLISQGSLLLIDQIPQAPEITQSGNKLSSSLSELGPILHVLHILLIYFMAIL